MPDIGVTTDGGSTAEIGSTAETGSTTEIGLTTESRGKWRSHFLPGLGVSLLVPRSWSIAARGGRIWCERPPRGPGPQPTLSFGPVASMGPIAASEAIAAQAAALAARLPGYASVAACELWIDDRPAWWLDYRHAAADGTRLRSRVCEVQQTDRSRLTFSCGCADGMWATQDPWFEVIIRSVRFLPAPGSDPPDGPTAR